MWKRNLDDDRIIALEDMPGWDKVKADTSSAGAVVAPEAIAVNQKQLITNKLTINVSAEGIALNIPSDGRGFAALYDMQGKLVRNFARGYVNAGTLQLSTADMSKGMYILRAKVGGSSLVKSVRIK